MIKEEYFIDKFKDVQTLPNVIITLSRLIADSESTLKDFEEVIKTDPILVTRLLRLVNSSFYGLIQKIDTIGRAVAYIGRKNLHNLAVTDALRTIYYEPPKKNSVFSKKQLWMHSVVVAICGKMVAERIFGVNGDDVYLAGILHDFGLVIEEQVEEVAFHKICKTCTSSRSLIELEQEAFGTNHCEICYTMTLNWNLPEGTMAAIRNHHTIISNLKSSSLTGILQISEYIASQLNYANLTEITTMGSPCLLNHIEENKDEYTTLMEDLPDQMSHVAAIYG